MTSSPAQFRSLLDGELDVALTSPDNVLAYRFNPGNPLGGLADVRIVAAVDRGMGLGLYGRPGTTAADLVGRAARRRRRRVRLRAGDVRARRVARRDPGPVRARDPRLDTAPARGAARRRVHRHDAQRRQRADRRAGAAACGWPPARTCCRPTSARSSRSPARRALDVARRLSDALLETAREIVDGGLDRGGRGVGRAAGSASTASWRSGTSTRLRDPRDGLVPDGVVDRGALETLVRLRTTYLPSPAPGGGDVLDAALDEGSGLVQG